MHLRRTPRLPPTPSPLRLLRRTRSRLIATLSSRSNTSPPAMSSRTRIRIRRPAHPRSPRKTRGSNASISFTSFSSRLNSSNSRHRRRRRLSTTPSGTRSRPSTRPCRASRRRCQRRGSSMLHHNSIMHRRCSRCTIHNSSSSSMLRPRRSSIRRTGKGTS
ncbi:hypothetical protein C8R46DRAFT_1109647 [Mycena filopes]|nr:hypothetical protein C8R46DRAFT_1109647 [Mycena filopes]